jgi:hypothetical protein
VHPALRANEGFCIAIHLLGCVAFVTADSFRCLVTEQRFDLFEERIAPRFGRTRNLRLYQVDMTAAFAAIRGLGGGRLHLRVAAVRALHTDLAFIRLV